MTSPNKERIRVAADVVAIALGAMALMGAPNCTGALFYEDRLGRLERKVDDIYCYLLPQAPECVR